MPWVSKIIFNPDLLVRKDIVHEMMEWVLAIGEA